MRVLIVDDERNICDLLTEILNGEGYDTFYVNNGADALKRVENNEFDLVLLDVRLPDIDGITTLKRMRKIKPELMCIMMSAFGTVSTAVEALKNGAEDFIEKPLESTRVITTVKNILEKSEFKRQSITLKNEMLEGCKIIGNSETILKLGDIINRCAQANNSVLILGETGTGKELVARNIHIKSARSYGPFVKVNCAALPGDLIESELFGYEKGAFTGAGSRKPGQFEIADNGILFLDEIGDMSPTTQAKVLRAIEDHEIRSLGGVTLKKVDVRIIAATNQNLESLVRENKFREDLYHRLNVLRIVVPPLRSREDDIALLANHFLRYASIENNKPIKSLTRNAVNFLQNYSWPGNVRELKHLMEKVTIMYDDSVIDANIIEGILRHDDQMPAKDVKGVGLKEAKLQLEKDYILSSLTRNGWNLSNTAKELNMDQSTLFRKMRKLGIKKLS